MLPTCGEHLRFTMRGDPHEQKIKHLVGQLKAMGVNVFHHNHQMIVSEKRVVVEKSGIILNWFWTKKLSGQECGSRRKWIGTSFLRRTYWAKYKSSNFFYDAGSNSLKNGSEHHCSPEFYQPHRKIELLAAQKQTIYSEFAELYKNGLSLGDIAKQTGKSKSVIRASLLRDGIELRGNVAPPAAILKSLSGKSNTQPPYGFCYFQGKVVPDQKEYENLMLIYQLWKSRTNPNRIADTLTEKNIQPRLAKSWNRNSVINILNRFANKQIILKGGHLELR